MSFVQTSLTLERLNMPNGDIWLKTILSPQAAADPGVQPILWQQYINDAWTSFVITGTDDSGVAMLPIFSNGSWVYVAPGIGDIIVRVYHPQAAKSDDPNTIYSESTSNTLTFPLPPDGGFDWTKYWPLITGGIIVAGGAIVYWIWSRRKHKPASTPSF